MNCHGKDSKKIAAERLSLPEFPAINSRTMHLLNKSFKAFAALVLASTFAACGHNENRLTELAVVAPDYVSIAESVTSMLSNELGNATSPPTPGALNDRSCMRAHCALISESEEASPRSPALFYKQAQSCPTVFGARDGTVFMRIKNVAEFNGCATAHGPFTFSSWPPKSGEIAFAVGLDAFFATTPFSSPPADTLDHIERGRRILRNWGMAALTFNGTRDLKVTIDQWAQLLLGGRTSGDPDVNRFHFTSDRELSLHLDSPWDSAPRIFNGSFSMSDETRHLTSTVHLSNVVYDKERCCHPLSGRLTLTTSLSPDPNDGSSTFILTFRQPCRKAMLDDSMGHVRALELPECY